MKLNPFLSRVKTVLTGVSVLIPAVTLAGCYGNGPERVYSGNEPSYNAEGWAPGHWVQYEYTPAGGKPVPVTVAVTALVTNYGGDYFRLELSYGKKSYRRATCVITPELEPADFLRAEGDVLPGSKEIRRLEGNGKPNVISTEKALGSPNGTSFQGIFGGGPGTAVVETDGPTEYKTLGGKKLNCREYTLVTDASEAGKTLLSEEISVTGIALVTRSSGVLEVVDFGKSGAGSAFE